MKEGIHPNYQPVVFVDANTGKEYITRSTKSSAEKKTIDGVEYSVISLEITADTHPFWTGKLNHKIRDEFKLNRADVGWYQIRMALKAQNESGNTISVNFEPFGTAYKTLSEKLRPQVYQYGFLK